MRARRIANALSFLVVATSLLLVAGCPQPPWPGAVNPVDKPGWNLVFNDEFDGPAVDPALWMTGFPWGRCSDIAYNTESGNISFTDGAVHLIANNEPVSGFCFHWDDDGTFTPYTSDFNYTTGMLYSVRSFKYGWFECRFRVPHGKGFNSAFWLYGPEASEIDVFEIVGSDTSDAQMTLHWKQNDWLVGTSQWPKHAQCAGPRFDEGYHTFALKWMPDEIAWYLDNWKVPESLWTKFIRGRHIPDVEMNVILTLGVGGMDGNPDATTPFPADFEVDYVRVYQTNSGSAKAFDSKTN